jgi:hypothetical protein
MDNDITLSCILIQQAILLLQATGGFQTKVVGQVNDLVACQPTPGSEWILGKILGYDTATGLYTIADEDTESNKGMYFKQVAIAIEFYSLGTAIV